MEGKRRFRDHSPNDEAGSAPIFDSLSSAFSYAQARAPHEVLELQRHVLRLGLPPIGRGL